ncbi:helix-turn-helix domain-containing protein [Mycolicibacterium sp. Y3]
MRLRESLSSNDSAFAKLVRQGQPGLTTEPGLSQLNREKLRPYRQLSADDLKELATLYEAGESMAKLAQKFECHRHTIMRALKNAGIEIRPQKRMTPDLVAQATLLYASDYTLEDVGKLFGLEASTIGKALKRSGVTLRPPVADRWHFRDGC